MAAWPPAAGWDRLELVGGGVPAGGGRGAGLLQLLEVTIPGERPGMSAGGSCAARHLAGPAAWCPCDRARRQLRPPR
jgi:hypothetical protein